MKRRGRLDAATALNVLVEMLAERCKKDASRRTVAEHAEIDALIWGATELVEMSGSWHPDEMLINLMTNSWLRKLRKREWGK